MGLDMYAWKTKSKDIEDGQEPLADWRKHNRLHGYMAELGELADATIKKDKEEIIDGVGDVMTALVIYCALQDISLVNCMEIAFDQIKSRKGILLPNGLFVKSLGE